jgi:anti-anti-sigma regulatory factor|tara:strand:- start:134 stop:559 length:426 start_codon:yes stop_codon:yes gene_type:complete
MANPETMEESTDEAAAIQLKNTDAKVVDESGGLKDVDVQACVGSITSEPVRRAIERSISQGKTRIAVDLSQVETSEEVVTQVENLERQLRQRGIALSITGLESAELQRADVRGIKERDGVGAFSKRDTGKAFAGEAGKLAA